MAASLVSAARAPCPPDGLIGSGGYPTTGNRLLRVYELRMGALVVGSL